MRKISGYFLAILMMIAGNAHAETITLVADNWCPYNCDPKSEKPGFVIEIAQKAFGKHGISIDYSVVPWTRAIEDTRQNKYTAIVAASRTDAPDFVFPSIPQGHMHNAFYVKKGNPWRFKDVDSLASVSVGVITDYTYGDMIDAYISKHKGNLKYIQAISGDNALETNVKKLHAGRIGALIEGQYVMNYYLAEHNLSDTLEIAGLLPPSDTDNLYIAFSPQYPKAKEYAAILSKELEIMRNNGELKAILAKYNVSDWSKQK